MDILLSGLILGLLGFALGYLINKNRLQSKESVVTDLKLQISKLEATNELQEKELSNLKNDTQIRERKMASLESQHEAMKEKLADQKRDMEERGKQMKQEFENLAYKIFRDNTTAFAKQNEKQMSDMLKPFDDNLRDFRKKVEEVYNTEAKERFSLGKEVQRLMELNQKISEEAQNLTNALKGNSKTQGDWGQMILENILENSGLEKDREYFVQAFLRDEQGKTIKNETGSRMQPDVIISYPDDRKVIIDAKVSLNAYTRFVESSDPDEQQRHLNAHLQSLRKHIDDLAGKNYQSHSSSLDFVMMFVPNEPAYIEALKHDKNLWNYAYSKRILLISPTNLIAALKLIEDLWKREYQNRNAEAIAERGEKLLDKLALFVESLTDVGDQLDNAKKSHELAMQRLKSGNGNLIRQAEILKALGVKSKKGLPKVDEGR